MSLAKSFSDEQTTTVQAWADAGDGLSEIQKKLASEMDIKVTYMELRFLIDDLNVTLKPDEAPEADEDNAEDNPEEDANETEEVDQAPDGDEAKVTISQLQRPGALISGTVAFADGQEAEWWLDQTGQLGLNPKTEDFRPSPEQMKSFQSELQQAVQNHGGF